MFSAKIYDIRKGEMEKQNNSFLCVTDVASIQRENSAQGKEIATKTQQISTNSFERKLKLGQPDPSD